jgi:hypothetical protein
MPVDKATLAPRTSSAHEKLDSVNLVIAVEDRS